MLDARVRVAFSWGVLETSYFNRKGVLTLDGNGIHTIKKLDNAQPYSEVNADHDGNLAFSDKANLYIMSSSGTKIIPRDDPMVPEAWFGTPYPLGRGEFAFVSNTGFDPSANTDIFLLEFSDGTSMHLPYWTSDIIQCNNNLYGVANIIEENSVQAFRISRKTRTTTPLGKRITGTKGIYAESGIKCHNGELVIRVAATSWNKHASYPKTRLAFVNLATGSSRQVAITDQQGKLLDTIGGGDVRNDSPPSSDATILGHEFIWALSTGPVLATDMRTGKTRLITKAVATSRRPNPPRIQGKIIGIDGNVGERSVVRLYDLVTGKMVEEVDIAAVRKASASAGGIFTPLVRSGFALLPER